MTVLSANVSILFNGLPPLERFAAAKHAGFAEVESWWPFAVAEPPEEDVDGWIAALDSAGVRLTALNFFAGDMPAGVRGVVSDPSRVADFRGNVAVVHSIAERTGCRFFNALYGQRLDGVDPALQNEVAIANLRFAARALAGIGGTVLIEALKSPENGAYPVLTLDDAELIRAEVGEDNVRLLFDTFHLAGNGVDLLATLKQHAGQIGHVQIADFPGRGAPGTGDIDFAAVFATLASIGYTGYIGAEFVPGDGVPNRDRLHESVGVAA
jgi:hydroxypyruvate isomerase